MLVLMIVISLLAVLLVLVTLALVAVASATDQQELDEQARIEIELRRAERRLNDVARTTFERMLDEARTHRRRVN